MASWIKLLLPAVPVLLEAAREARRSRHPQAEVPPARPSDADGIESALARTTAAVEQLGAEVRRLAAHQAALERRLDVLAVVSWSVAGVLAVVIVGLVVRLAAG
jgi:hypothetical protein